MLVSVIGFGSVWRQRLECSGRVCPAVYYNTTGVMVKSGVRQRPQICGYARFDAIGGFNPNYPSKMIGRVFECTEPSAWMGCNRLLFRRLARRGICADRFLVVASSSLHGHFAVGTDGWKSADTCVLSFSECGGSQELMLLMDTQGWIQSDLGSLVVGHSELHRLPARLTLYAQQ